MRAALVFTLTLVTLLLAVAGVGYYVLNDPDRLKSLATRLTLTHTGRHLEIHGPLRLELSTTPRITAEDVRLSNPAWASEPYLLQADYLSAQIGLIDLIGGLVNVLDFDAQGVVVQLEMVAGSGASWDLLADVNPDQAPASDADADPAEDAGGLSFVVQGLALQDVSIHARLDGRAPIDFSIAALTESTDAANLLSLDGHGTLNGEAWTLSGHVGPLDQLISAGRVTLDVDLTVHTTRMSVQGRIEDLASLTGVDVGLQMSGPDARFYGAFTGIPEAFEGDIALQAALRPATGGYRLTADGHIASFDVQADLLLADLNGFAAIEGSLGMSGPDAALIASAAGVDGLPAGPFTLAIRGQKKGTLFDLEDLRFETAYARLGARGSFPEYPELDGGHARVRVEGADVGLLQELLGVAVTSRAPYTLNADLHPDTSRFRAEFLVGSHSLLAEGVLGEEAGWSGLDVRLQASGTELGEVALLFGMEELHGAFQASARVGVTGNRFDLQDLLLVNSPFRLSGALQLADLDEPDRFTVDFQLDAASLTDIGRYMGVDTLPDRPVAVHGSLLARDGAYRLGATTLRVGQADLEIAGPLGRLETPEGLDLSMQGTAPGLNTLLLQDLPEGYGQRPVKVSYRLRGHRDALEIADLQLDVPDGRLRLDAYLTLLESRAGSHLRLSATGSRFDHLLPAIGAFRPNPMPYDLSGRFDIAESQVLSFSDLKLDVGQATARIDGRIDLDTENQTDLTLTFHTGSLAELGRVNEKALPDIPVALESTLTGVQDAIRISALEASWGDSQVQATGLIEPGDPPRVQLTGSSTLLSLHPVGEALVNSGNPPDRKEAASEARRKLIPDVRLPFDALRLLDADLDFSIGRFEGFTLTLDDVELVATLQDGALEITRLAYQDPIGAFTLQGYLRPRDGTGDFGIKVTGSDADLGLFVSPDQPPDTLPRYSIDMDVEGSGSTLAEIAATLSGPLLVSSDGGSLSNAALRLWTGDFLESVINLLNPFSAAAEPYTAMECVVVNARLDGGRLKLEPGMVMRTDKVNAFVFGSADLATETLDLSLATQARQGIGLSAASITNPYFRIGGSFAAPKLQVDAKSAAIASGFATATGGLSILAKGFWDRFRGAHNPCPDFLPQS